MTLTAKQSAFLDEYLLDLNGKLRFGRDIARPPTILFNTVGRSVVLSIVVWGSAAKRRVHIGDYAGALGRLVRGR